MSKIQDYYANELLLEREEDIKNLREHNVDLHKKISNLRYSLLKVRTELSEVKILHYTMEESQDQVKNSLEIIQKALSNE